MHTSVDRELETSIMAKLQQIKEKLQQEITQLREDRAKATAEA